MSRRPTKLPVGHLHRYEKTVRPKSKAEYHAHNIMGTWRCLRDANLKRYQRMVPRILALEQECNRLSNNELLKEISTISHNLRAKGLEDENLWRAFALVREVTGRTLGMYHFESQILGGLTLLHGCIAEMQTGEGKTLTAILPAAVTALMGVPVHVVTANDYLAQRDKEETQPVYEGLGLTVGCITQGMSVEQRQEAYMCDVVYCTNSELAFDYLKDQLILEDASSSLVRHAERLSGGRPDASKLMLRGLHFALVDEADSVLFDEARTPLVISAGVPQSEQQNLAYQQALEIAAKLTDEHYQVDRTKRQVQLLPAATDEIAAQSLHLGAFWSGEVRRLELVHKALMAMYLFEQDLHYIIRDGKLVMIDEHTGRLMPDRSWEQGLHQLIEIKENCEPTDPRETLSRITYQRFFSLYGHLCGMTGTTQALKKEFWSTYSLPVVTIPTHAPSLRKALPVCVFDNQESQWKAVVHEVQARLDAGQAVLIGTDSVAESEKLSAWLKRDLIAHQVLNAKNDEDEAEMVAKAGQVGAVTVATSMAGRGTDIKLAHDVKEAGGLHVILTQFQDSSRIDRQLIGRCARQGDPGSYRYILSILKSDAMPWWYPSKLQERRHATAVITLDEQRQRPLTGWAYRFHLYLLTKYQKNQEKHHARIRKALQRNDERQAQRLAFSGRKY
ncbi:MAG: DEAD/DEAH box helicase [Pontibacterium sp.]